MQDKVILSSLDYEEIRKGLKLFIKNSKDSLGNPIFANFDFEGTNLSLLINTLAYNSFQMSYYMHQVANECFLDTARKRSSVVSIAKELNYIPRSTNCAKGELLVINSDYRMGDRIRADTKFYSKNEDGTLLPFSVLNDIAFVFNSTTERYEATCTVYQGLFVSRVYEVVNDRPIVELPTHNIDIHANLLKVNVYPSRYNKEPLVFTRAQTVIDLNENSQVYFIQENWKGFYEVYFGNGLIGMKPMVGAIIEVVYFNTNGESGNNCLNFYSNDISPKWSVKTVTSSFGGLPRESLDSIKYLAPRNYEAQHRCVTFRDFITVLKTKYRTIRDISIWGGNEHTEPQYGKVFICMLPSPGYIYTEFQKNAIIKELIENYNVITISPVIVDPDIIYCHLNVLVTYNAHLITITNEELIKQINDNIVSYFTNELNIFNKNLIFSKLTRAIEDSHSAIGSCSVDISLEKRFVHQIVGQSMVNKRKYIIEFSNLLKPGSLKSNLLQIQGKNYQMKDVPETLDQSELGTIILYRPVHKKVRKSFSFVVGNQETRLSLTDGVFLSTHGTHYPSGQYLVKVILSSNKSISYLYDSGSYVSERDFSIRLNDAFSEIGSEIWFSSLKLVGATVELSCDIMMEEIEILNPHQGTINYRTGRIELDHFYVTSYSTDQREIVLTAESGIGSNIKGVSVRDYTIQTNQKDQILTLSNSNSKITVLPR